MLAYAEISRRGWVGLSWAAAWALLAAVVSGLPILPKGGATQRAVLQDNIGAAIWNTTRRADEASPFFLEAIRLSPQYAEPYRNMGTLLKMNRRWEEAAIWYRRALAIQPADPKTLEGLGICATNRNLTGEAMDWFHRALAVNPRLPDAHFGLALNLEKLRLSKEAQVHFAEAARLDPSYARGQSEGPIGNQ